MADKTQISTHLTFKVGFSFRFPFEKEKQEYFTEASSIEKLRILKIITLKFGEMKKHLYLCTQNISKFYLFVLCNSHILSFFSVRTSS